MRGIPVPVLILLLFTLWLSPAVAGAAGDVFAQAESSYQVLQNAERDFRRLQANGELTDDAAGDYHAYIARLREQFLSACDRIPRHTGSRRSVKLPCPTGTMHRVQPAAIDLEAERTGPERMSALNRQLDAALSDFDEMLLQEQEQIKAAKPVSGAAGGGSGVAGMPGDAATTETAGTSGAAPEPTVQGDEGERTASASSAGDRPNDGSRRTTAGNTPPDIPDGSDDDIVARQLREAAENETDPALRARLWEEYRKYKRGTR
jgi:hypothetical protein